MARARQCYLQGVGAQRCNLVKGAGLVDGVAKEVSIVGQFDPLARLEAEIRIGAEAGYVTTLPLMSVTFVTTDAFSRDHLKVAAFNAPPV